MEVTDQLKSLGFTLNEAKAYVALLQHQPVSAYEVAKKAGIPTSKVYESIAKLSQRGVVQAQEDPSGQQHYVAMNPADLMDSIRRQTESQTRSLQQSLENLPGESQSDLIWPLPGFTQVRDQALALIDAAQSTILISLWAEELAWLEEALRQAESRGVKIALVHFGEPNKKIGATYHHPVEKTLYAEKGGRGLTLVVDAGSVVIANFREAQAHSKVVTDGAWSRNRSFVTVAEDYVKHDVYITKVTRFLGPAVVERFGEDFAQLRDVFDAEA